MQSYQEEINMLRQRVEDQDQQIASLIDYNKDLEYSLKLANDRKELEQ